MTMRYSLHACMDLERLSAIRIMADSCLAGVCKTSGSVFNGGEATADMILTLLCAHLQTCQHPPQQQYECACKIWQATATAKAG